MNNTSFERRLLMISAVVVSAILAVMPFHATLTVWASQFIGHYTLLRLWKEVVLVGLSFVALYCLARHHRIRATLRSSKLFWLIAAFLGVQVVWGLAALALHTVIPKALGYGWIVDARFLVFFGVVWVLSLTGLRLDKYWQRLVFVPAAVVILIGLLQYFVLPYDFLKHMGYGAATISPYEDINNNTNYIRVMSTLRGANPLGAYLVLVLSLATVWLATHLKRAYIWKDKNQPAKIGALACSSVAGILVLVLTFSRGAWIGLLVSGVFLVVCTASLRYLRTLALFVVPIAGIAAAGLLVGVQHNAALQNVLWHTETNSAIKSTSNEGHASALQTGLQDMAREPLGRGVGTAGPASVYNTERGGRIAENYFIQIAQEMGWIGLVLFITINVAIGRELWQRRSYVLALGLLSALVGLSLINLFSHAWADDTLAYIWWGLAGIALALPEKKRVDAVASIA